MSAGVIIMNKNAIALAADSAVTIGNHLAIHNSANKVFALSKVAPVGVITYANAAFMDIPIEVIIKQYKNDLGCKKFDKLSEYLEDFLSYLTQNQSLFHFDRNERNQVLQIIKNLFDGLIGDTQNLIKNEVIKQGRPLNDEELCSIRRKALALTNSFVRSIPSLENTNFADQIKERHGSEIKAYLKTTFPYYEENEILQMLDLGCEIFDRAFVRNGFVGLAFSGFGESQIFPSLIHIMLTTMVNGKIRYIIADKPEISEKQFATITPLAQDDVMRSFLTGIHNNFEKNIIDEVTPSLVTHIKQICDNAILQNHDTLSESLGKVISEAISNAIKKQSEAYLAPMINSVGTLPIEELALLAESMINITSLRRRVALDNNIGTVGGPVDVAVITKADGLIWIRRKHFFDRKYNPQYFYSHYMLNEIQELQNGKNERE